MIYSIEWLFGGPPPARLLSHCIRARGQLRVGQRLRGADQSFANDMAGRSSVSCHAPAPRGVSAAGRERPASSSARSHAQLSVLSRSIAARSKSRAAW